MPRLTDAQRDRAAGVLLATAAGDALGAPYEFGPPLADDVVVAMAGPSPAVSMSGPSRAVSVAGPSTAAAGVDAGRWTDDTAMAVAIAEVTAAGGDLRTGPAQDALVARWVQWVRDAPDAGVQTRAVLGDVIARPTGPAARAAARALHRRTGRSGGNGSLMRTAPLALAHLDDPDALVEAAGAVSGLTHHDPDAGEACVLWCLAIRHAVLTGALDVRVGLAALPRPRAAVWGERLDVAERSRPADFTRNGWVVQALQAAWCAIATTPVPPDDPAAGTSHALHLQHALTAAVRGGRDTDTVAAIAGGLLGAVHGASAVPAAWRRVLHGWPGLRARDLVRLGLRTATPTSAWPDVVDYSRWPHTGTLARHPADPGVWLGGVDALASPPPGVDAVVSLCRVGRSQRPSGVAGSDHVEVWLVDSLSPAANPNLAFVLADTVDAVRALRREGRTVLLHCVQAHTRTPLVAAAYGAAITGADPGHALAEVAAVLPHADVDRARALLTRATSPPA